MAPTVFGLFMGSFRDVMMGLQWGSRPTLCHACCAWRLLQVVFMAAMQALMCDSEV
jgi:hypothetical protein